MLCSLKLLTVLCIVECKLIDQRYSGDLVHCANTKKKKVSIGSWLFYKQVIKSNTPWIWWDYFFRIFNKLWTVENVGGIPSLPAPFRELFSLNMPNESCILN